MKRSVVYGVPPLGGRELLQHKKHAKLALMLSTMTLLVSCRTTQRAPSSGWLANPNAPEMNRRAPDLFDVRFQTSRGDIVIEVHRDWAPHGADRFYNLVRAGYYDGDRFYRVIKERWAQFGINGDPRISKLWRERTIPDDPFVESNARGTIAFAFAIPNGRTTQVFINLRNNSATHDREPFVPFGKVTDGMDIADSLNTEYGESSGGGIRAGKQGPLFEVGNTWLIQNFPRLDYIKRAAVIEQTGHAEIDLDIRPGDSRLRSGAFSPLMFTEATIHTY